MLDYLDRLRAKPRHVRMQFAFLTAVVVTVVVGIVWAFSLSAKFLSNSPDSNTVSSVQEPEGINELIDTTTTGIQDIVRQAEVLRGRMPDDTENIDHEGAVLGGTGGLFGTSSSGANNGSENTQKTAPRKVLIATSSSEKSE